MNGPSNGKPGKHDHMCTGEIGEEMNFSYLY